MANIDFSNYISRRIIRLIVSSQLFFVGVYYSVGARQIWPYFGCGIQYLQKNQCNIQVFLLLRSCGKLELKTRMLQFFAYFIELFTGQPL